MLKNIIVTNYLGEDLTLSMFNPAESGFYIKSVDGLGPAKASINMLHIVSQDGGIFSNARADKRNIVLTLGAYDISDIESLRQKTYKYFSLKRKLKIKFELDNMTAYAYGFVESNEPDIFSKQETFKISILCPFPYFYDAYENSITFSGDDEEHQLSYDGDVETGMKITINFQDSASGIKITQHGKYFFAINDTYLEKILPGGFKENDILKINTLVNEKSIILTRDGEEKNLLNALDRNSKWFKIGKGNNTFKVEATEGLENMNITMSNPILYEGI